MLPGEENLTSDASWHLLGLREETLARIPQDTRDWMRKYGQDRALGYVGKRALRPVTAWDTALERAAIVFGIQGGMLYRGFRPSGEDARLIAEALSDIKGWLELVSLGKVEAWWEDSSPTVHEMGPLAGSVRLSDDEMRSGYGCGDPGNYVNPRGRCAC